METPIRMECPICMDDILDNNKVVTECGHTFHCSCLMRNVSHNGFGCPYCRSVMAEKVIDEEEDEYEEYEIEIDLDEDELYSNNSLTSFRMFNQMIDGEVVEEEPNEDEDEDEDEEEEEEEEEAPDTINQRLFRYVSNYIRTLGMAQEDLTRHLVNNARINNERTQRLDTTIIICDAMIKCMNTYYGNNTNNININNINNTNNILEEYLNTRREEPNTNENAVIRSNDDIMLIYRDWWQSRYILPNIAETKIPVRETSNKVAECI